MRKFRLAFAAGLLWLLASTCAALDLRVGLSAEVTAFDPHFHNYNANNAAVSHVFETLVAIDTDSRVVPVLAESWRNIDDLTWEFRLRRGVRFHDGSELTADDVLWSLARIPLIARSPGSFAGYVSAIVDRQVVDSHTLRLRTATPYPMLLADLAAVFIVSRKATQGDQPQGLASEEFSRERGGIGTGPFRLVRYARKDRIELERHAGYWGQQAAWDRVALVPLTNDATRTAALLKGDVDVIEAVPSANLASLRASPGVQISTQLSNRVIYFVPDVSRDALPAALASDAAGRPLGANPLKDLRVRQAISKSINRAAIAEKVMDGLAEPAGTLVPRGRFGHDERLQPDGFDPETARRLLAEAGFPDGFSLTLHGPNNRYVNDEQILQTVAQSLARIGVRVKVSAMPFTTLSAAMVSKDFALALLGFGSQSGDASIYMRALLATRNNRGFGGINWGGYSNRRADELLEDSLRTIDPAKREAQLKEAVGLAMRELGVIPLHFQVNVWAARGGIRHIPRFDERTLAHQFFPR